MVNSTFLPSLWQIDDLLKIWHSILGTILENKVYFQEKKIIKIGSHILTLFKGKRIRQIRLIFHTEKFH